MTWIKSVAMAVLLAACCGRIYDFRGANIPADVNSFSVEFFNNDAPLVNPQLSILFTEKLKTKFQTESRLKLVAEQGDFRFSGAITDYRISQASLDENGAAQNQLNITVHVVFFAGTHAEKNYEKDYVFFKTYKADQEFSGIENDLSAEISDVIVQKIYADVALDW